MPIYSFKSNKKRQSTLMLELKKDSMNNAPKKLHIQVKAH